MDAMSMNQSFETVQMALNIPLSRSLLGGRREV